MKRFLAIALAASFSLVAGVSYAAAPLEGTIGKTAGATAFGVVTATGYAVGDSANGIHESRHNLGSMGSFIHSAGSNGSANTDQGGPANGPGGTSEICVFCHTPHHTVTATTNGNSYAPAPLWNRMSQAPTSSFKAYGTTIGGTVIANSAIGGVTLACLSCHDGVTTFDVLANAPGAGGMATTYGSASSAWGLTPGGTGFIDENAGPSGSGATTLGGEARLNIGNSGGDLSNDHPMSVAYSDGNLGTTKRASLRDRSTDIASIDLYTGLATSTTNSAALVANLSQNKWAVKGFISNTAKISDLLRNDKVECSSCHDPHFKNLSNIDQDNTTKSAYGIVVANDGLFLRRVGGNAGSGVCRTCHNK